MKAGDAPPDAAALADAILGGVPASRRTQLARFLLALFRAFVAAHFVYLEVNPLVMLDGPTPGAPCRVVPLDLAAKVDEAAAFLAEGLWAGPGSPALSFPPPFGRQPEPEERAIRALDAKTGSSLKLTILNRAGRVWTMVAGGGASVVYADTICDLGFGAELANYGRAWEGRAQGGLLAHSSFLLSRRVQRRAVRGPDVRVRAHHPAPHGGSQAAR